MAAARAILISDWNINRLSICSIAQKTWSSGDPRPQGIKHALHFLGRDAPGRFTTVQVEATIFRRAQQRAPVVSADELTERSEGVAGMLCIVEFHERLGLAGAQGG